MDCKSLYNQLSAEAKDWLDANIETLDSSITDFGVALWDAKDTSAISWIDSITIYTLLCYPEFCGLSPRDLYNIVAHEEEVLEWSHLDRFNRERKTTPIATRFKLNMFLTYDTFLDNSIESTRAMFREDPDVAFITCDGPEARPTLTPCVDNYEEKSKIKMEQLRKTDYWVAIDVSDPDLVLPSKWTPGHPAGRMSSYHPFGGITPKGTVNIAKKQTPSPATKYDNIIFVPAKKVAQSGSGSIPLRTFLPEEIVDKYNLPKAIY